MYIKNIFIFHSYNKIEFSELILFVISVLIGSIIMSLGTPFFLKTRDRHEKKINLWLNFHLISRLIVYNISYFT